jgi:hypothetical protein
VADEQDKNWAQPGQEKNGAERELIQVSDPLKELSRSPTAASPATPGHSTQADDPLPPGVKKRKLVHPFPLGQVHDHSLNPVRQVLGQAANPQAPQKTFEISIGGNGAPVIQSNQTGNFWIIGWDTLIKLALAEGVERMKEPPKPKLIVPGGMDITP